MCDLYAVRMLIELARNMAEKESHEFLAYFRVDPADREWLVNATEQEIENLASIPTSPFQIQLSQLPRRAVQPSVSAITSASRMAMSTILAAVCEQVREDEIAARISWGLTPETAKVLAKSDSKLRSQIIECRCISFSTRARLRRLQLEADVDTAVNLKNLIRLLSMSSVAQGVL